MQVQLTRTRLAVISVHSIGALHSLRTEQPQHCHPVTRICGKRQFQDIIKCYRSKFVGISKPVKFPKQN